MSAIKLSKKVLCFAVVGALCAWIGDIGKILSSTGSVAAALAADSEKKEPEYSDSEKQRQLTEIMDEIFRALNTIFALEGLSDPEKRERALDYLSTFRYGKDNKGYVKVVSLDGVIQVEPNILEMVGKDLHSFEDPNVFRVFEDFIRICYEQGQGWSTYVWPVWGGKKHHVPTVSLVRYFAPLDCAIVLAYNPITIVIDDMAPPYIDDHQPASPI